MKTAILLGSLNRGGTETLMLDLCQNLKKIDFDAVGIYRKGGVLEQEFLNSDVPFILLKPGKNMLKYLWKLRKLILNNKVEVIHAQQPIDALYARIACIGLNVKFVLTFHGFDYNGGTALLRFIIPRTDKNIFVSNYQQEYYSQKYNLRPDKQVVIYNGIKFSKFDRTPNETTHSNLRKELKIDDATLLMGMVGNFVPGRDQMTLCRFLKLIKEQPVDFHFIFIGSKSETFPQIYEECLDFINRNGLSERVTFAGSREDVPALLNQLDAFLYATDHDTFGIAVVEAMAAGVPVFVNDWEVMNEITEEGKLATIYKTKDEKDLLEKFMLFLQTRETYKQKAKDVSTIVRQKYSIEKYIENLKIVYSL